MALWVRSREKEDRGGEERESSTKGKGEKEWALPDPLFCINSCTHGGCWNSWPKVFEEWFLYSADTSPTAVHALTHSSPNLFYPVVGKPIMSDNSNLLPGLQTLPCSSLMFSHLLEVPESPHRTIISYSPSYKSDRLHRVCFSVNIIHHEWLTSFCCIRDIDIFSVSLSPLWYHLHFSSYKQCDIYREIHLLNIK